MEKHRNDYFASCPTGLEELLALELKHCGIVVLKNQRGGAAFQSHLALPVLEFLLRSRVASRVFKLLYSFECHSEKSMYQELASIKWKAILDVFQTFRLTTIYGQLPQERQVFTNSQFTTLKAKDALVDWFNHEQGRRPSVNKDEPDISLLLRIDDAQDGLYRVQVLLDLSGNPLSQRGYRRLPTEAPVKENLAAGILKLLKWDPQTEGLVDGMCGSGTFLIEGALMAGDIMPQYLKLEAWKRGARPWAFLSHQWFTKDKYISEGFADLAQRAVEHNKSAFERLAQLKLTLTGGDLDASVLKVAKENVHTAGLSRIIPLINMPAQELPAPATRSLFICNPPYGERLQPGDEEGLRQLYHELGENWKKHWKGHRAAVLTGNIPLLKAISLRTSQRLSLYNGDIECRVAEYRLY